jgi:hypothetical protein
MYSKGESETYHYLKKLRHIVDRFNEKYNIDASVKKNSMRIFISFYLKNESVEESFAFFKESIDYLNGILGEETESEISSDETEDSNYNIMNTLALKCDTRRKQVEVIYREDNLTNVHSPEFKILLLNALYPRYNSDISIRIEADDIFCFDFDTDDNNDAENLVYSQKKIVGDTDY